MILAVTGHRPDKLGGYSWTPLSRGVVRQMSRELQRLRPDEAISGMALGVDQWFAWLCVRMGIPFTAAIPFEGQELAWRSAESRANYHTLLGLAKRVEIVTHIPADRRTRERVSKAMKRRNVWMVRHCDHLLAVWDGSSGGTSHCVREAERVGRPVTRLFPLAA